MSYWVGSRFDSMNGHFKMGIPKTGFHELIHIWGIYFHPQIITHTHTRTRAHVQSKKSCWRVSLELCKPRKRHECKNTHRLTHPHRQPAVFFSQSFAILPSLPNVELLCCVNSTHVVETRKVSAHRLWPPPHKSSLSHSSPGLSERKHRTALCTNTGPYE